MNTSNPVPCPICGAIGVPFQSQHCAPGEGPDRDCLSCDERYYTDSEEQQRADRDKALQLSRLAAYRKGNFFFVRGEDANATQIAEEINRLSRKVKKDDADA